jgi:pimeloyl-ACP methyl ester carboxylesterase
MSVSRSPADRSAAVLKVISQRGYPLADHAGERPATPEWFSQAVSNRPHRRFCEVDGAAIELLTWGRPEGRGLLFLHGNGGNADWWSFTAPFLAGDYRCAAISWSGMGASDHRASYSMEQFAREASAAIDAAGLAEGDEAPIIIGHSLGGYPAIIAGEEDPRVGGVVVIDSLILPMFHGDNDVPNRGDRDHPVYSTIEEAVARFRLIPRNNVDNHFAIDWIARQSMKPVPGGWTWRADPALMTKIIRFGLQSRLPLADCPIAYLRGEISEMVHDYEEPELRQLLGKDAPLLTVQGAGHQVMIDQPQALVATLAGLLAHWPPPRQARHGV